MRRERRSPYMSILKERDNGSKVATHKCGAVMFEGVALAIDELLKQTKYCTNALITVSNLVD